MGLEPSEASPSSYIAVYCSNLYALLQEAAHAKELAHWDAKIRERNDELTRLTGENTQCLTSAANYIRSQMDMERTLANTQVLVYCLFKTSPCLSPERVSHCDVCDATGVESMLFQLP